MAYTSSMFQVVVEGALGPSESWANVWTVFAEVGAGPRQDAVDVFHEFYADFANGNNNAWTAAQATVRELSTGIGSPGDWESIVGAVATTLLPTQLAVRVSLDNGAGVRGGPFLCGFTEADNDAGGLLATTRATSILGGLDALASGLVGAGFTLSIDRPTVETVTPANRGRVGERWDVIRRRSNDTLEAYQLTNLAA